MSESTALAVVSPDKPAEKLPEAESVTIPAAIMLAANSVIELDGPQPYLGGVYLHARDRRGRVVGTDGHRMFVASFEVKGKMPSWMASGLLLAGTGLKARLTMLAKGEEAQVKLTHVKGTHRVQLTDVNEDTVFNLETVSATYPDYEKVIGADSFVALDEDGRPVGGEWKPIGIGSGYLKQVGEIARMLDNGRPKSEREKTGMAVRAFHGDTSRPVIFDFPGWPGAVLCQMPLKVSSGAMSKETAALVAPAVKGSIAALRAHSTRWLQVAKAATTVAEREAAIAKSKEFQQRVAALMDVAPVTQIGGKKQEQAEAPAPEPQPEEQKPEPEEQPEEQPVEQPAEQTVGGPTVKRRKIKVPVREAAE